MNQLLIATNNKGKIHELQDLLTGMKIDLITPSQIGLDIDVIEDGLTYAENATRKAVAFAGASGLISLADDSGLEVDALKGEPGLYSARYGSTDGDKLRDKERRTYLLSKLNDKPRPWTARFRAVIAVAIPEGHVTLSDSEGSLLRQAQTLHSPENGSLTTSRRYSGRVTYFEGTCEGEIIPEERGTNGFGYDPIFLLAGLDKTMAELSMKEKNRLSHRAKAVMSAKEILEAC
jgi:XTP/dITP diphosphohydrolase